MHNMEKKYNTRHTGQYFPRSKRLNKKSGYIVHKYILANTHLKINCVVETMAAIISGIVCTQFHHVGGGGVKFFPWKLFRLCVVQQQNWIDMPQYD